MKKILALVAVLNVGAHCIAQQTLRPGVKEPEFVGSVVYVGSDKYVPLQQENAVVSAKGGFYSKVKTRSAVKGFTSTLKIHPIDKVWFLVRVADNSVGPKSLINVFKLEQDRKADERYVIVYTSGTFTGVKSPIEYKEFEFSKYGEHSVLISFPKSLETGEYAITLEGTRQVFNVFTITTDL